MKAAGRSVIKLFSERFEPDGDSYIFRAKLAAAGYRVSRAEHDRMVAEFSRRSTWLMWGMLGVTAVAFTSLTSFAIVNQTAPEWWWSVAIGAVLIGLYLIPFHWIWGAPPRELRGRPIAREGLGKAEARKLAFGRLTWGQFGAATLAAPAILLHLDRKTALLSGWNLFWIILTGALVLLIAVQAARKIVADRQNPTP